MDIREVPAYVREHFTYYRPGSHLFANVTGPRSFKLTYKVDTIDTSDPTKSFPLVSDVKVTFGPDVVITPEWLADIAITLLAQAEVHELREGFRVDGHAPFHGHRDDGKAEWARVAAWSIADLVPTMGNDEADQIYFDGTVLE